MEDDATALKDLELPEEEVIILEAKTKLIAHCSTQVALKSSDKPAEQKSTKQWAIQVDLEDHTLNEFHSRIPRMAHKVCDLMFNKHQLCLQDCPPLNPPLGLGSRIMLDTFSSSAG